MKTKLLPSLYKISNNVNLANTLLNNIFFHLIQLYSKKKKYKSSFNKSNVYNINLSKILLSSLISFNPIKIFI